MVGVVWCLCVCGGVCVCAGVCARVCVVCVKGRGERPASPSMLDVVCVSLLGPLKQAAHAHWHFSNVPQLGGPEWHTSPLGGGQGGGGVVQRGVERVN